MIFFRLTIIWQLITSFFLLVPHAYALPELLFRATSQLDSPETVKQAGGFLARGVDGTRSRRPPIDISLYNHARGSSTGTSNIDSGFISTTRLRSVAFSFLDLYLVNTGYIYHIRPSLDFFDVNGSLGQFSPNASEQEFAALGVIEWNQIVGWEQIEHGHSLGFINNPDYRQDLYPPLPNATGIDHLLAGFPRSHPAWNQEPWRTFLTCMPTSRFPRSTDMCTQYSSEMAQQWAEAIFYRNYQRRMAAESRPWISSED